MRRPVLVVQDDLLTESALRTVMVVLLTSNLRRAEAIGNVLLRPDDSRLQRDSVALVCQVLALDKACFDTIVASLSRRARQKVDAGLKLSLSL